MEHTESHTERLRFEAVTKESFQPVAMKMTKKLCSERLKTREKAAKK